jgi:16S rRNA (uracil1498-N3)-methyltransferase
MGRRYYSHEPIERGKVTLDGSEAHHLLHVMRAQPGEPVVLFDGRGDEYDALIVQRGRSTVELAVAAKRSIDRELPWDLVLGIPLPKGERERWLIEKAVELGVTRLVPLRTEHSIHASVGSKLQRYAIEAAKQCGRNKLMEIGPLCSWQEWISQKASRRLIAQFGGCPLSQIDHMGAGNTLLAIGPEGGWAKRELEQAGAEGWQQVDLGRRVLRMETAALALIAALVLRDA